MWSRVAENKDVEIQGEIDDEQQLQVIDVPRGYELKFRRNIKRFIQSNYELLEEIYNMCFKDYKHITKEDFYIFAYEQSVK